jgi:hypothetical protein
MRGRHPSDVPHGLKITRPDDCDTTLQCTPSFHGWPRIERVEFALDVALLFSDINPATRRALQGLPASDEDDDASVGAGEFGLTGKSRAEFTPASPLFKRVRDSWPLAVQGAFFILTGSDVWSRSRLRRCSTTV